MLIALALAVLGLSALAATRGLPSRSADLGAAACSSCDARHHSMARIRATVAKEP
jgi:hypothetical protein